MQEIPNKRLVSDIKASTKRMRQDHIDRYKARAVKAEARSSNLYTEVCRLEDTIADMLHDLEGRQD